MPRLPLPGSGGPLAPAASSASGLPRVMVAGLKGGAGKTTVTLGLIHALRARGLTVAPFKKGPDYIDPFWHAAAAGRPCRNLDPYLMGREQTLAAFAHFAAGAGAAVVEGNRGLFDGLDARGTYSSAELAKLLGTPVLLLLDCTMTSRTVAAVALGVRHFDPDLPLCGVVLNPVANPRQEKVVRRAILDATGLPVLGAIPRLALDLPQRHMGLLPPQEHRAAARALGELGRRVAEGLDIPAILAAMAAAPPPPPLAPPAGLAPAVPPAGPRVRVGVVRDAAFGFYYPENLEALANHGADLVFCSALADAGLPPLDALYLGGGFPETHAALLAANRDFRAAVGAAAREGLPIYAECGGLMYLGENLVVEGVAHPMAGVLPLDCVMQAKPQGHGYTRCRVAAENPFWPVETEFTAHEFHYSRSVPRPGAELAFAYRVLRGGGLAGDGEGIVRHQVLATYHHVHALGMTGWAAGLAAAARRRLRGGR